MDYINDLPFITSVSAIEIDRCIGERDNNLKYTKRFLKILEENQLTDDPNYHYSSFPHLALWREFRKSEKNKDMRYFPQLALEMKLFTMELKDIESLSKERSRELLHTILELYKEFSLERARYSSGIRYFAA